MPVPTRGSCVTKPDLRVAIVGYGTMGKAHSYAYRVVSLLRNLSVEPKLAVLCGRNAAAVERAAESYGFAAWATDWREIVARPDVDLVDICTPPGTHVKIAEAAMSAGKAVLCEKPLATSYAEARHAAEVAGATGRPNAVGFNYRRLPALALMLRMVAEGAIGDVRLWRGVWLSD